MFPFFLYWVSNEECKNIAIFLFVPGVLSIFKIQFASLSFGLNIYYCSIYTFFFQVWSCNWISIFFVVLLKKLENVGINPTASLMLSKCSSTWVTLPPLSVPFPQCVRVPSPLVAWNQGTTKACLPKVTWSKSEICTYFSSKEKGWEIAMGNTWCAPNFTFQTFWDRRKCPSWEDSPRTAS